MPEILRIIIFISLGFIFLMLELFTPGFGLAGIAGLALIAAGCFYAYLKLNLLWAIITAVISLTTVIVFFKLFKRSPAWKKMRLDLQETKEKGFTSASDMSGLLNKEGITISALRPSGIALIEGKRTDVTAESFFIDKDKKVRVVKVEGNRVIVREE